jgi:hypothetical protein
MLIDRDPIRALVRRVTGREGACGLGEAGARLRGLDDLDVRPHGEEHTVGVVEGLDGEHGPDPAVGLGDPGVGDGLTGRAAEAGRGVRGQPDHGFRVHPSEQPRREPAEDELPLIAQDARTPGEVAVGRQQPDGQRSSRSRDRADQATHLRPSSPRGTVPGGMAIEPFGSRVRAF